MDSFNNENNMWEIRQKHINNLAHLIKFGGLKDYQRETKEIELWNEVLILGKQYANKRNINTRDESDNDFTAALGESLVRTLDVFGKADNDTGEFIPFMKLFWSIFDNVIKWEYTKDLNGVLIEKDLNSEFEARSQKAKDILKTYAKSKGLKYLLPKSVNSIQFFVKEITSLGMPKLDAEALAEGVFSGTSFVSINSDDDSDNKPVDIVDSLTVSDLEITNAIGELLTMCHRCLASKEIKNETKDYIRYYMTIAVYESDLYLDDLYAPYINHRYMEVLITKKEKITNYEVLAEIVSLQADTVRKKIAMAKKCLLEAIHNNLY